MDQTNAIVPYQGGVPEPYNPNDSASVRGFLADWLSGRKGTTTRSYEGALRAFAAWLGSDTKEAAAATLLRSSMPQANALVLRYRNTLYDLVLAGKLKPGTLNVRLSALRSMAKTARVLGVVPAGWQIVIPGERVDDYKDTATWTQAMSRKLLASIPSDRPQDVRDRAIVGAMLATHGFREGEIVSMDLAHLDVVAGKIWVLGKGRLVREPITLTKRSAELLAAWVAVRGSEPGPLFRNYDPLALTGDKADTTLRLTGSGIRWMVDHRSRIAGLGPCHPHLLRHASITHVLRTNGGDVVKGKRFSRHKRLDTLQIYLDNLADDGLAGADLAEKGLDDEAA